MTGYGEKNFFAGEDRASTAKGYMFMKYFSKKKKGRYPSSCCLISQMKDSSHTEVSPTQRLCRPAPPLIDGQRPGKASVLHKNIKQQIFNANADDVSRDIMAIPSLYEKYARPSSDAQTITSTTAAKAGTSNNIATLRQFDKVFSQKIVLTLLWA